MCSPVLVPHMVGMALLPGAETPKVSTWQVPPFKRINMTSTTFKKYQCYIYVSPIKTRMWLWQVVPIFQHVVNKYHPFLVSNTFDIFTTDIAGGFFSHLEWRLRHCQCSHLCFLSLLTLKIGWLAGKIILLLFYYCYLFLCIFSPSSWSRSPSSSSSWHLKRKI